MTHSEPELTGSRPKWRPTFLREIEALGDEVGFMNAVRQTLEQDNITVEVDGELEQLHDHQGGILFVGDHKNQWEFVALIDMLSRIERNDMLNVAKFYVKRQIHQALGQAASKLVIPVYPRILASDREEFFNSETLNRVLYRKYLLSTAESADANTRAIEAVVERLDKGGVGNIFPTGSVVDSLTHPWREGVGRIINELPDKSKEETLVVPYKLDDIPRRRLVGAIAMRGHGMFGRPQRMSLRLGPVCTTAALIDSLPDSDRENQTAITQQLRSRFIDYFGTDAE
jgi:hypothetical protein